MSQFDQHGQHVARDQYIGARDQYIADGDINIYQPPLSLTEKQRRQNRRRMLDRVEAIWIDGVLEPSLQGAAQITLELENKPSAIVTPFWSVLQEFATTGRLSSATASIVQVYDDANGEVLILGEPGAGKTTLLLELTRALLERARQDEMHPVPVVFSLSSWAVRRQPLTEWLASELHIRYQVPLPLATSWIETDQVLPLLDGLDEVAAPHRAACVEAINTYRQAHGLLPTVVCSRQTDYLALSTRLLLRTAVVVQPLTAEQIETYLTSGSQRLEVLRQTLRQDADLQALARTPLMLNVLTIAYQGISSQAIAATDSLESKREQVFATYVQRVLTHRSTSTRYTRGQIIHWLCRLAAQMKRQSQTVFYLERMQPDWLGDRQPHRLSYRVAVRLSVGFVTGLIGGSMGVLAIASLWLLHRVPVVNGHGLLVIRHDSVGGLLVGAIGGLIIGLIHRVEREIKPAEVVVWSWKNMRRSLTNSGSLKSGLLGLLFGLIFGLLYGLRTGRPLVGLGVVLNFGLIFGLLFGLVSERVSKLLGDMLDKQPHTILRHKKWRSVRNRMLIGLASGLAIGLALSLIFGLIYGLQSGLVVGLLVGLFFGLVGGLLSGLLMGLIHHVEVGKKPVEMVVWLGVSIWQGLVKSEPLRYGLLSGLLVEPLFFGTIPRGPSFGQSVSLGLLYGLMSGLVFELIYRLMGGLSSDLLEKQILIRPNQGIRNSARNSAFVGLASWLVTGSLFGLFFGLIHGLNFGLGGVLTIGLLYGLFLLELLYGLLFGLMNALSIGLSTGGVACVQHTVLRWFLWRAGDAPWNYPHFLDYAAERILLRKVGGGYIFVHRLLLEYFASLDTTLTSQQTREQMKPSEGCDCGHQENRPGANFCPNCGKPKLAMSGEHVQDISSMQTGPL